MQGRLSRMADGKIQSFPWDCWREEFAVAEKIGLHLMEWTLDQSKLHENPLLTVTGQRDIKQLCQRHEIAISSLTGDCFMQAPFWKATNKELCISLKNSFMAIANACQEIGITYVVVPLVDNGRIENQEQEDQLIQFLDDKAHLFASKGLKVIFESDFTPVELARFISFLDSSIFGINYDIGNSAALGFIPQEEFAAYGNRIMNVHVKDRMLGGTTVPLGTGNAKFDVVFKELRKINYAGNLILQTARAMDDDHASPLIRYRDMTIDWMTKHGLAPDKAGKYHHARVLTKTP